MSEASSYSIDIHFMLITKQMNHAFGMCRLYLYCTCILYGLYDIYGTIHADTEGFDNSQKYGKLSFGVE